MKTYLVKRNHVYWVCESQIVVARDEDHAEDVFYDTFDPILTIGDVFENHGNQIYEPVSVKKVAKT